MSARIHGVESLKNIYICVIFANKEPVGLQGRVLVRRAAFQQETASLQSPVGFENIIENENFTLNNEICRVAIR